MGSALLFLEVVVRIVIVCSAHGFGHVTRQLEVARRLEARGAEVVLFTAAPEAVVREWTPTITIVPWVVDVGIVQHDSLTEDHPATIAAVHEHSSPARVQKLAQALALHRPSLVVADCPPAALAAARAADLPAVAVGNFTWPWIYRNTPGLRDCAALLEPWQRPHMAASLWPGPGLPGFARVRSLGLVGRRATEVPDLGPGRVLVSFGGLGLADLDARLPVVPGVRWLLAPPMPRLKRPDCSYIEGVPYPALVAAADVVLTKPGYGIFAEAALAGARVLWVPRGHFPEARFLTAAMSDRGDSAVQLPPHASAADWRAALTTAIPERMSRPRPDPVSDSAADELVDWLLERASARRLA